MLRDVLFETNRKEIMLLLNTIKALIFPFNPILLYWPHMVIFQFGPNGWVARVVVFKRNRGAVWSQVKRTVL